MVMVVLLRGLCSVFLSNKKDGLKKSPCVSSENTLGWSCLSAYLQGLQDITV